MVINDDDEQRIYRHGKQELEELNMEMASLDFMGHQLAMKKKETCYVRCID